MIFTFLGTSAAVPTSKRNLSALAFAFEQEPNWNLVDCGEGTQHQLMKTNLTAHKLRRIFLTHLHGDHVYGLPGLLAHRSMMSGAPQHLDIYGPQGTCKLINTILEVTDLHLNFSYSIHEITKNGKQFQIDKADIKAIPLSHNITSFAYFIKEHSMPGAFNVIKARNNGIPSGPLYGKLKKGEIVTVDGRTFHGKDYTDPDIPGRSVIIGGDNDQPDLLIPYLKEAQLLIHEATHTRETKEKTKLKIKHSTAKDVGISAQKASLPNLILTHFSSRFSDEERSDQKPSIYEIRTEAQSVYSGNLFLANDFDTFILDRTGALKLQT